MKDLAIPWYNHSVKLIESLDRSSLGFYAVPEKMLMLADHIERMAVYQTVNMGLHYSAELISCVLPEGG